MAQALIFQTYGYNNDRIEREMEAKRPGSSKNVDFVSDVVQAERLLEEILIDEARPLIVTSQVFRAPIFGCCTGSALATEIKRRRPHQAAFFVLFTTSSPEELTPDIRHILMKDDAGWKTLIEFLVAFVVTGQLRT